MDPFRNDPFEDIVREFLGGSHIRRASGRGTSVKRNERIVDFIETEKKVYVVFELPGYEKEDVTVNVEEDKVEISAKKKKPQNAQKYLQSKLSRGIRISKTLPKIADNKKYDYSLKNGLLELEFEKNDW